MTDTATAALAAKTRFYENAKTLFDLTVVNVMFGISVENRDRNQAIAFLDIRSRQEPGPLSASNRSRNEDLDLTVVISVASAGDVDDKPVHDTAFGLLRQLEQYVRKTNTTLDGTCMWCFLTSYDTYGYTPTQDLAQGRLLEIEATFTARIRITG